MELLSTVEVARLLATEGSRAKKTRLDAMVGQRPAVGHR